MPPRTAPRPRTTQEVIPEVESAIAPLPLNELGVGLGTPEPLPELLLEVPGVLVLDTVVPKGVVDVVGETVPVDELVPVPDEVEVVEDDDDEEVTLGGRAMLKSAPVAKMSVMFETSTANKLYPGAAGTAGSVKVIERLRVGTLLARASALLNRAGLFNSKLNSEGSSDSVLVQLTVTGLVLSQFVGVTVNIIAAEA